MVIGDDREEGLHEGDPARVSSAGIGRARGPWNFGAGAGRAPTERQNDAIVLLMFSGRAFGVRFAPEGLGNVAD